MTVPNVGSISIVGIPVIMRCLAYFTQTGGVLPLKRKVLLVQVKVRHKLQAWSKSNTLLIQQHPLELRHRRKYSSRSGLQWPTICEASVSTTTKLLWACPSCMHSHQGSALHSRLWHSADSSSSLPIV
ncbi:hypothetical protein COCSUDRAFT_34199 [Coccomyxa subellipsoidea C-169]|uniref:Uncharacterized protein n=1 Tax=Coccomyxa subellipsoidea (strain C-169) TaxID=574566 RepID=I0YMP5_COCSC|nr:hypothetical protein COCSUDRAFT_34199 [Coccomyxa subellipsoidea C-169]EIE19664.1 hypothetical protein COCSUDRAFT_34199 [Coccomyxa subellipsoidea C-169]|eukprot:XP_005644208.1 hypothetical protein COCSUDRAFT_34199 [Coccomyxa subellipsoidea C-169]